MSLENIKKKYPWYDRVYENGHSNAQASCAYCGAAALDSRASLPPDVFVKSLKAKGWSIGANARKPACPDCVRKFKAIKKKGNNTMSKIEKIKVEDLPKAGPTTPQSREIFSLLETYFDVKKGSYSDGYSDEKVAKDVGLAREVITKVRAEAFGSLKTPQWIIDLRAENDIVMKMVEEIKSRLDMESGKYG